MPARLTGVHRKPQSVFEVETLILLVALGLPHQVAVKVD